MFTTTVRNQGIKAKVVYVLLNKEADSHSTSKT